MLKLLLLLVFILPIATQNVWFNFIASSETAFKITSSCRDEQNNIYFAGIFTQTIQIGSNSIDNRNTYGDDIFVVKLDSNGTLQWHFSMGTTNADNSPTMVYQNNSILISAMVSAEEITFSSSPISFDFASSNRLLLVSASAIDGTVQWAKVFRFNNVEGPYTKTHMICDNTTGLYMSGNVIRDVQFESLPLLVVESGSAGTFVVKIDTTTGTPIWSTLFSTHSYDSHSHLVLDEELNYLYVSGMYTKSPLSEYIMLNSTTNIFIAKLNAHDGSSIYSKALHFGGRFMNDQFGLFLLHSQELLVLNYNDPITLLTKVDAVSGDPIWTSEYPVYPGSVHATIDNNNHVIMCGTFQNTIQFDYLIDLTCNTTSDVFVVKVNSTTGKPVWSKSIGTEHPDDAFSIVVDGNDNIIISGTSRIIQTPEYNAEGRDIIKLFATKVTVPSNSLLEIQENITARTTISTEVVLTFKEQQEIYSQIVLCYARQKNCIIFPVPLIPQLVFSLSLLLPPNTLVSDVTIIPVLQDGSYCDLPQMVAAVSTKPAMPSIILSSVGPYSMRYNSQLSQGNIPFTIIASCTSVPINLCPSANMLLSSSNGMIANLMPNVIYTLATVMSTANDTSDAYSISFSTPPLPIASVETQIRSHASLVLDILYRDYSLNKQVLKICQTIVSVEQYCYTRNFGTPSLQLDSVLPSQEYAFDFSVIGVDDIVESETYSLTVATPPAPSIVTVSVATTTSIALNMEISANQGNINAEWFFDVCILNPIYICTNRTVASPTSAIVQFDELLVGAQYTFLIITYNALLDTATTQAVFSTQGDPNLFALLSLLLLIPMTILCLVALAVILIITLVCVVVTLKRRRFISKSNFEEETPFDIELYEQLAQEYVLEFSKLHYDTSETLGSGAQATVYKATYFGIPVAAKIFLLKNFGVQNDLTDFEREAKFLAEHSKHPNIVRFIGIAYNPEFNRIALVTELCKYGSLASYITNKRVDWNAKLQILHGIASGMNYLHCNQIIHRDLKCENVLLDSNMHPKIIDFGLSKKIENLETNMTMNVGTASYLAPEVLRINSVTPQGQSSSADSNSSNGSVSNQSNSSGTEVYTSKVDVYSFSIIMWCLLHNNAKPYDSLNDIDIISKMSRFPEMRPNIDVVYGYEESYQWFIQLMKQCWKLDHSSRPSFEEILIILQENMTS